MRPVIDAALWGAPGRHRAGEARLHPRWGFPVHLPPPLSCVWRFDRALACPVGGIAP